MIYATIDYNEQEQLCYIDGAGERLFLLKEFFRREHAAGSVPEYVPVSMIDFIRAYRPEWTDHIAKFFGEHPEYAVPTAEARLLAPIPAPARNLVCLGKNYQAHARELKGQIFSDQLPVSPIYFTKPDHTVIGTKESVLLHRDVTSKVDYEIELAVIIGKKGIDIPKEKAEEYIFGYTVANDISARDLQQAHTQWYKGKSLTIPIAPWAPGSFIGAPCPFHCRWT